MRKKITDGIRIVAVMAAVYAAWLFFGSCIALAQSEIEQIQQLNQQMLKLYQQGRYAEAVPIAQKVLSMRKKTIGPEHSDTAASLNNLAELYRLTGDYKNAKPLYESALRIFEKVKGPEHPDTAQILSNLGELYRLVGDYANAESLGNSALQIRKKVLGDEHPDTAQSLNNLAALYDSLGDFAKAKDLYKKALQIYEKTLGAEHPQTANCQTNLAEFYRTIGDFAKAEDLHKRALQTREKVLGQEHPDTATSLNNLAVLYQSLGNYTKAESLFKRALQIREVSPGPEHPDTAVSLNNLAELYRLDGDYKNAKPLYERALQIFKKTLGAEHLQTATILNNQALLYKSLSVSDFATAENLFKRTLSIFEKNLRAEHPSTATTQSNLAGLYRTRGDFAESEPLYKKALQIFEKTLGAEHPSTVSSLNNLGALYADEDNFENSLVYFHQARQADEKLIDHVMGFTSEDQKAKFIETRKWGVHSFFTLVSQHFADKASARKDALDIWLKRKGLILEAQKKMQDALIHSDNPEMQTVYQEYASVRARLSRLIFAGPGKEGLEAWQKNKADLEAKKQELEAKLSRLSGEFASKQKVLKADTDKIAKTLPANTVLLEFARFGVYNFKAKGKENKWNPDHYLAFVLPAGKPDAVAMIDIGEAEKIDNAIEMFLFSFSSTSRSDKEIPKERLDDSSIEDAKELYDLVFKPLRNALGSATEIFLSPDGNLNLIPFEALVTPDGKFLVEEYTFNYLAAGRDLLAFGDIAEKGGKPLLMGDPDYDLETPKPASPAQEQETSAKTSFADMFGREKFPRLLGTREEVTAIASLLGKEKAFVYTDRQAVEDVLMKTHAPRILHLATHGFFLQDQDLSSLRKEDRGFENPLLRSGIALTGANRALLSEGQTQGIVTAEKILGLKLRGTDLTVLSACESGVGNVQAGEGVYGLRRAFVQAGTKSLVMSLWSVTDQETKKFMTLFYQNLLSGKMSKMKAFRTAQLQQMENLREEHGEAYPFYWAAFVFLGEPGDDPAVPGKR